MEAAEDFEDNGGKKLHVIPCINDREEWVNVLAVGSMSGPLEGCKNERSQ